MADLLERLSQALGDRYAIESEIGRGGMATVFLAEDLKHGRQVAIKVMHPELTAAIGAERFLREIGITARLQHHAGGFVAQNHRILSGIVHLVQLRVTDTRSELFDDHLIRSWIRQVQFLYAQHRRFLWQHNHSG